MGLPGFKIKDLGWEGGDEIKKFYLTSNGSCTTELERSRDESNHPDGIADLVHTSRISEAGGLVETRLGFLYP